MSSAALYHGFTPNAKGKLWAVDVIEIGLAHPFLLLGILAMAAVHKTTTAPQAERPTLLAQADAHMSSCLATYKKNLAQPTLETSLPMFLLSSVLVTYNLASARVQEPDDPIKAMLHCFRLLRGVIVVIGPYWKELNNEPVVRQVLDGVVRSELDPTVDYGHVGEIMAINELITQLDTLDAEACRQAIQALEETYLRIGICDVEEDKHGTCMIW